MPRIQQPWLLKPKEHKLLRLSQFLSLFLIRHLFAWILLSAKRFRFLLICLVLVNLGHPYHRPHPSEQTKWAEGSVEVRPPWLPFDCLHIVLPLPQVLTVSWDRPFRHRRLPKRSTKICSTTTGSPRTPNTSPKSRCDPICVPGEPTFRLGFPFFGFLLGDPDRVFSPCTVRSEVVELRLLVPRCPSFDPTVLRSTLFQFLDQDLSVTESQFSRMTTGPLSSRTVSAILEHS